MRPRVAAAVIVAISAGILCLAIALWGTGKWKFTPAAPQTSAAAEVPVQPSAVEPTPNPPANPPGNPPIEPPPPSIREMAEQVKNMPHPEVAPPPPLLTGEANRSMPEPKTPAEKTPPHLAMPLAGINPNSLSDTFYDKRDGHEHDALDIPSPRGTPVLAVAQGNVAKLFTSKDGGLTVYQFDDTQAWCYYYAHLDRYAPGLVEGTLLRKGEVLGYVGSTGNASPSAPHLHFAVFELQPDKKWWHGKAIDPLPLLKAGS
jgi:murein DD-endopeptidase MepM/ murein hydrolase activator NlpD